MKDNTFAQRHISRLVADRRALEASPDMLFGAVQILGGTRPVPATIAEDLRDRFALDRAEMDGDRARRFADRVECEVFRADESAFAKNGCAPESVAELADVARPMVLQQHVPGVPL